MVELAGIIILGIFAQWLAWKFKVPAILPLILIGLAVGPLSTFFTPEGAKLLEPRYQDGKGLFPGDSLFYFVSLSISVILFEGGASLKYKEIRGVGSAIMKLIIIGSITTFIGSGVAAHYLLGLSWSISFLFAGLIIVTGPTVIGPILRNLPLNKNVSTVLKWEGILIDPLGALVAVLVFEFIITGGGHGNSFTQVALWEFTKILMIGFSLGFASAYLLYYLLKKELVPHYLLNVFVLTIILLVFVASDMMAHESGLLTVVIMGMVFGNLNIPNLDDILSFKESLSVLLVSILFILLSANINVDDLLLVMDWRCFLLFGIVVLILRPLGVFSSTGGSSGLSINEKLFISWIGPRGIVAAGVSSLFGLKLTANGVPGAEYITPLVFMVVLGTVLLNATTAGPVGSLLGVMKEVSDGILIIGANKPARIIGNYLKDSGRPVVLIDNNSTNISKAEDMGMSAIQENIYSADLSENLELLDVGYLMALTGSAGVNRYAIENYKNLYGENGAFRLLNAEELKNDVEDLPDNGLFSPKDDYINISEIVRDYPEIKTIDVQNEDDARKALEAIHEEYHTIPLFMHDEDNNITILPAKINNIELSEAKTIVYLGKEINFKFTKPEKEMVETD